MRKAACVGCSRIAFSLFCGTGEAQTLYALLQNSRQLSGILEGFANHCRCDAEATIDNQTTQQWRDVADQPRLFGANKNTESSDGSDP